MNIFFKHILTSTQFKKPSEISGRKIGCYLELYPSNTLKENNGYSVKTLIGESLYKLSPG